MFRKSATSVVAAAASVLLSSGGAYALLDGERCKLEQARDGTAQAARQQVKGAGTCG